MRDDITRAVLARAEVARCLRGEAGRGGDSVEARIRTYLDELRTTQRYSFYRALKHPLYPILRKIERCDEHVDIAQRATAAGRVVYVSNHKSHTDYLVEMLVLDDNGVRPPAIAAGINLFGGPLGLLHKHVTGAIPIRRNTKDPVYLATLEAYIGELLRRRDLFFYLEGGRSYSGELKAAKTGLLHAALLARDASPVVIPTAIAYDLVLEDRMLSRQALKRRSRPFTREVARMVRDAVGYQSRAFVTFGEPIPLGKYDPESRRDVHALAHEIRTRIGLLYKVLPTALLATAMRPWATRQELEERVDALLATLRSMGANLGVATGREAVEHGTGALVDRHVIVVDRTGRYRVRDRVVLRYYARTIQHLFTVPAGYRSRTH